MTGSGNEGDGRSVLLRCSKGLKKWAHFVKLGNYSQALTPLFFIAPKNNFTSERDSYDLQVQ